jgi:hypothetical protein
MDIVEDNKKNKLRLISKHGMHFIWTEQGRQADELVHQVWLELCFYKPAIC